MPDIIPFKAVRPTRDKVSLVAARSYETYTKKERRARLDVNPYSFLHIVNPGYKYQKEITGKARFQLVRNRYEEFKEENTFIQDTVPGFYMYKIVDRDRHVFSGIIGAASVADYLTNRIKKHEDTIAWRESLFKEYLDTVGFNAEAVLLTYPDNETLASILESVMQERPEYEFTTTYRDTHYLWPIQDDSLIKKVQQIFNDMPNLYIADGHHRSASSALLSQDYENSTSTDSHHFFMSYLIPESHLKIHEFNRIIKDLNGLSKEEFLIQLDTHYRIENRGTAAYKPSKKHHFSMYLDGEFYSLYLRKSHYKFTDALSKLDTHILYNTILKPILGIEDLRDNDRLSYTHGKKDLVYLKNYIDNKGYTVGFNMLPITIEELKAVADEDLTMPPKSTYIEPKLRSGITIYEF